MHTPHRVKNGKIIKIEIGSSVIPWALSDMILL